MSRFVLDVSAGHGLVVGDGPFRLSSAAALPAGLNPDSNYWVVGVTSESIQLDTRWNLPRVGLILCLLVLAGYLLARWAL